MVKLTASVLFGFLVIATSTEMVVAQGAGGTTAPAGMCWIYNPTYCYLGKILECSDKFSDDPCDVAGDVCGQRRVTDQNTYQELVSGTKLAPSAGFLEYQRGSDVLCGHLLSCRYTVFGMDEDGNEILKCNGYDNDNAGDWLINQPALSGTCSPGDGHEIPWWEG